MMSMTLHFDDADPIATCTTKECHWHGHGDSVNGAVLAWTAHVTRDHRGDWDD
jgi:hypothetical protein